VSLVYCIASNRARALVTVNSVKKESLKLGALGSPLSSGRLRSVSSLGSADYYDVFSPTKKPRSRLNSDNVAGSKASPSAGLLVAASINRSRTNSGTTDISESPLYQANSLLNRLETDTTKIYGSNKTLSKKVAVNDDRAAFLASFYRRQPELDIQESELATTEGLVIDLTKLS